MGAGEYVVHRPGGAPTGHFGPAVSGYGHSTAPNRRFPDLVTQRLLKAVLAGDEPPYGAEDLTALAAHCTEREGAADRVERRALKSAAALFLAGRVDETFGAVVTGGVRHGHLGPDPGAPVEGMLGAAARGSTSATGSRCGSPAWTSSAGSST